jgi:hypothetical protein
MWLRQPAKVASPANAKTIDFIVFLMFTGHLLLQTALSQNENKYANPLRQTPLPPSGEISYASRRPNASPRASGSFNRNIIIPTQTALSRSVRPIRHMNRLPYSRLPIQFRREPAKLRRLIAIAE